MSNRLDNTRVVVFDENYPKGKNSKVIYEKGSEHAIHYKTVEKLEAKGVKMKVSNFDEKKEVAKAKEAFEKANEKKD